MPVRPTTRALPGVSAWFQVEWDAAGERICRKEERRLDPELAHQTTRNCLSSRSNYCNHKTCNKPDLFAGGRIAKPDFCEVFVSVGG